MALASVGRLVPFEIIDLIGVGGRREVYAATDTNLARRVAIKVLPGAVTSDPDCLARFDGEARTLADLIASGGEDRSRATPRAGAPSATGRARGLPFAEVVAVAREIVEALEAAHEPGIAQ